MFLLQKFKEGNYKTQTQPSELSSIVPVLRTDDCLTLFVFLRGEREARRDHPAGG